MTGVSDGQGSTWTTTVAQASSAAESNLADLAAAGVHVPLFHRSSWLASHHVPAMLVSVRDLAGVCGCAFVVELSMSRTIPGHLILRTKRFGSMASADARRSGLAAAKTMALDQRVLRYHVEVFASDETDRESIARDLASLGFRHASTPRSYRETIAIDLSPTEEALLASFHRTARRHIRAAEKKPVDVAVVDDPGLGPRLGELLKETLDRTGGSYMHRDWVALITLAREHPELVRIVGMFRSGSRDSASLLAFAIGYNHGDYVEYGIAASTRQTQDTPVPMGYALAWDLIRWAKCSGAAWFDFGGITRGTHADAADPLGGISDFKRNFSTNVVTVGDEWVLVPRPIRASLAAVGAKLASRLLDLRRALK